jgi:DNA-3-methyladenine glycosylase
LARLQRSFFEVYTPKVARSLLGALLVRVVDGERLSGRVVETEAYRGASDPASHAYRGETPRNSVMFGESGHAYVYFTMGMHHCLNLTTEPVGTPGAVLIRAMEPVEGLKTMLKTRGVNSAEAVASGPGKLTQALRIDRSLNGEDVVTSRRLFLEEGKEFSDIGTSQRIGISRGRAQRWRFFARGNLFVSRARPPSFGRTHN